jgi:hypothetical protein
MLPEDKVSKYMQAPGHTIEMRHRGLTDPVRVSLTEPSVSDAFCWAEFRASLAESVYDLSPLMVAGGWLLKASGGWK